jgi:hypothetical protein
MKASMVVYAATAHAAKAQVKEVATLGEWMQ